MIDAVRLRIVLVALAGWVNRHQLEVIEYLRAKLRLSIFVAVCSRHSEGSLELSDAR